MSFGRGDLTGTRAPEFPAGLEWLNSAPLSLKGLQLAGRATLIDFWTYSCVNCLNTLPYLKEWHKRYSDKGLTIIGVRTPEFEFEKNAENTQRAIAEQSIAYPVVLDNDYLIWNLYANRWWPRKLLIAPDNTIVYDHIGEGGYAETERRIRELLIIEGGEPAPIKEEASDGICYRATPELYLGYQRGLPSNLESLARDKIFNYQDPGEHQTDMWYLAGEWLARPEYIEYKGKPGAGKLILIYAAFSVNLVAGLAPGAPPTELIIKQKTDQNINERRLIISGHKMYPLIKDPNFKESELTLIPQGPGLRLYAFTFGGCQ